jgi:hypothetical protein
MKPAVHRNLVHVHWGKMSLREEFVWTLLQRFWVNFLPSSKETKSNSLLREISEKDIWRKKSKKSKILKSFRTGINLQFAFSLVILWVFCYLFLMLPFFCWGLNVSPYRAKKYLKIKSVLRPEIWTQKKVYLGEVVPSHPESGNRYVEQLQWFPIPIIMLQARRGNPTASK